MAVTKEGPGWWLASDGQWYPPDLHPDITGPRLAVRAAGPTEAGSADDGIEVAIDDLVVAHGPAVAGRRPTGSDPTEADGTEPDGTESDGTEIQPLGAIDRVLTGAAAVLVAASLAVFVLVAGDPVAGPDTDPTTEIGATADGDLADEIADEPATALGPTSVHELRPGDCVRLPDQGASADAIDTVEGVACDRADHRVVAVSPVAAADEAYDTDAVERAGREACTAATGGGTGLMLAPSPTSWAEGDRRVVCLETLN